jgi:[protein-PII] uridylyltransferase
MPTTSQAVAELAERAAAGRKALLAADPAEQPGTPYMHRNADFVDGVLRSLYQLALSRAKLSHGDCFQQGVTEAALVATGGYGRRELAPFSDIDLAFVPSHEDNPFVDALINNAFRLVVEVLMDATDLEVGYAFRPLADLPALDHQTKTSLLDARLVVGSRKLFERLKSELAAQIDVVAYLQDKAREQLEAGRRAEASVYSVQPDIKRGPGGLRDIQAAIWMAQVRYGTSSRGEVLERLVRDGVVRSSECQMVRDSEEYLRKVRTWLHLHAQRKQDVLLPELQGAIGRAFGYRSGHLTAGQLFMREHFRRAAHVRRFAAKVSRQLLWAQLPLAEDFMVLDGRLQSSAPRRLRVQPELAVFAYRLAQRYEIEFHPDLDRVIEECVPLLSAGEPLSPAAAEAFLEILGESLCEVRPLREMRDRGLLRRILPEAEEMMTFVPADPAHELTVGEHALRVLDRIATIGADTESGSLVAEVLGEVSDREILALGALLHDVGKVRAGEDHALVGAEMAGPIADRLRLSESRKETLVRLVREHLTLPRASRLFDLADPATMRETAAAAGDRDTLKLLFVLSHADTQAVGAGSYTESDLELLEELYVRVNQFMAAAGDETDLASEVDQKRQEVSRRLADTSISSGAVARLCAALPPGYLLNTPLGTLAAHASFLDRLETEGPVIDVWDRPGAAYSELTLCVHDSPTPGLLSRLTGTLFADEVDIHSAQVFTLEGDRHIVLDTLWISHQGRQLSEARRGRVARDLREMLDGRITVSELLVRAGKPQALPARLHQLALSNELSDLHTVIRVTAGDVPGLLYWLTRSVSALGLDIHVAKITTWAGRAEDSFYVSDDRHRKLPDADLPEITAELRRLLESGARVEGDGDG